MDTLVSGIFTISNGAHIGFFLREMRHGIGFQVLDPFFICILIRVPTFHHIRHLLHNPKKLGVGFVHYLHTDIEFFAPCYVFHNKSCLL